MIPCELTAAIRAAANILASKLSATMNFHFLAQFLHNWEIRLKQYQQAERTADIFAVTIKMRIAEISGAFKRI